jgi:hypothetical protein
MARAASNTSPNHFLNDTPYIFPLRTPFLPRMNRSQISRRGAVCLGSSTSVHSSKPSQPPSVGRNQHSVFLEKMVVLKWSADVNGSSNLCHFSCAANSDQSGLATQVRTYPNCLLFNRLSGKQGRKLFSQWSRAASKETCCRSQWHFSLPIWRSVTRICPASFISSFSCSQWGCNGKPPS